MTYQQYLYLLGFLGAKCQLLAKNATLLVFLSRNRVLMSFDSCIPIEILHLV